MPRSRGRNGGWLVEEKVGGTEGGRTETMAGATSPAQITRPCRLPGGGECHSEQKGLMEGDGDPRNWTASMGVAGRATPRPSGLAGGGGLALVLSVWLQ